MTVQYLYTHSRLKIAAVYDRLKPHVRAPHFFEDISSFLRQAIKCENTDLTCRTSPNALSEMKGRSSLTQCEQTGISSQCNRRTGMKPLLVFNNHYFTSQAP